MTHVRISLASLTLPLVALALAGCGSDNTWKVGNNIVSTGIKLDGGSRVQITAKGEVKFSNFGPTLNADGDTWNTPFDYPARDLKKNSLICRFGTSPWYQCGTNPPPLLVPPYGGELILRANDKNLEDNKGKWSVQLKIVKADSTSPPSPGDGTSTTPGETTGTSDTSTQRSHRYGGIALLNRQIATGLEIKKGSTVKVEASGLMRVGFDAFSHPFFVDPSGVEAEAGVVGPAKNLRKYSLVYRIGPSDDAWYQGGTEESHVVSDSGELLLSLNEHYQKDNVGYFLVSVTVTPEGAIEDTEPLSHGVVAQRVAESVNGPERDLHLVVAAGSILHVSADPAETVSFGGLFPASFNADGEAIPAGYNNFLAPGLKQHSLIVKVGKLWYQGGTGSLVDNFVVPFHKGPVVLAANDDARFDNTGGWPVNIDVHAP